MDFYIISPPKELKNFNSEIFDRITDIISVKYFQFRPKFQDLKKRIKFVEKYHKDFFNICHKKRIKLIINDDIEIAKQFSFDGIHLGQNDTECKLTRSIFGKNFTIGISFSNSFELYLKAKKESADYVAFGPMFSTKSKKKKVIDSEKIKKNLHKIKLPITLIGGINHKNIFSLKELSPNCVAIINSLWNFNEGPIQSALLFKKKLEEIEK